MTAHRRFTWTAPLAVLVVAAAPGGTTEPIADPTEFVAVFDDPTAVAREVDQVVGSVLEECMAEQNQTYVLSPTAQFDIRPVTFEDALKPTFERSLGDILPQLVAPEVLNIDRQAIDDTTVLRRDDLLIDPDILVDPNVIDIAEQPSLDTPRLTDLDLRLQPDDEGYGISLSSYQRTQTDPNRELVENLQPAPLIDYEIAMFGREVADLQPGETGGCAEESYEVLLEQVIPELEAMDAELVKLERAILDDSEFEQSLAAWSDCVADSGLDDTADLDSLDDAVAITRTRFEAAGNDPELLARARAFEQRIAVVDFGCRARTTDLTIAAVVADVGAPYVDRSLVAIDRFQEVTP